MTQDTHILRTEIQPGSIHAFQQCARKVIKGAGCPEYLLLKIDLILEELLMNVYLHGYKEHPGEGQLTCAINEDCIFTLTLEDWAPPFNLLDTPPPDVSSTLRERLPGGLGIHIIRQFAKHIEYERRDNRNIVTVIIASTVNALDLARG